MAEFRSLRRYYLSKRYAAKAAGDFAIAALWQRHQEAEPQGTLLPVTFPCRADLAAAGYTTTEDLLGADECELVEDALLSSRQARAVLAAFAAM